VKGEVRGRFFLGETEKLGISQKNDTVKNEPHISHAEEELKKEKVGKSLTPQRTDLLMQNSTRK